MRKDAKNTKNFLQSGAQKVVAVHHRFSHLGIWTSLLRKSSKRFRRRVRKTAHREKPGAITERIGSKLLWTQKLLWIEPELLWNGAGLIPRPHGRLLNSHSCGKCADLKIRLAVKSRIDNLWKPKRDLVTICLQVVHAGFGELSGTIIQNSAQFKQGV